MGTIRIDLCKGGLHELEEIYIQSEYGDSEIVVRWCKNCGAVVVDMDCDGRTTPGAFMKMKFPKIILDIHAAKEIEPK